MRTFLVLSLLVFSTSHAFACAEEDFETDGIITGAEAQELYESLPGPVKGPYCTGLCLPGKPCDPTCTSFKKTDGTECTKVAYTKSHRVTYRCTTP